LALLDFRNPVPLSTSVHQGHVLSAAFGILQLGLVALAIPGTSAPAFGWIGVHSLLFLAIYLSAPSALRSPRHPGAVHCVKEI
jgi:hypothetical protein